MKYTDEKPKKTLVVIYSYCWGTLTQLRGYQNHRIKPIDYDNLTGFAEALIAVKALRTIYAYRDEQYIVVRMPEDVVVWISDIHEPDLDKIIADHEKKKQKEKTEEERWADYRRIFKDYDIDE